MRSVRFCLFLLVLLAAVINVPSHHMAAQTDKLDKLVLAGPPGPLSIPLVYLVSNNKLADVADDVELVMWEDQNQLRAIVAGNQADFVTVNDKVYGKVKPENVQEILEHYLVEVDVKGNNNDAQN